MLIVLLLHKLQLESCDLLKKTDNVLDLLQRSTSVSLRGT